MIEDLAYIGLGFATVFVTLETAWHLTVCKIKGTKPCVFKEIKNIAYKG